MLHVTDLKDTNLVDKIIAYTSVYQPFLVRGTLVGFRTIGGTPGCDLHVEITHKYFIRVPKGSGQPDCDPIVHATLPTQKI